MVNARTLESLPKPGKPVGATECALLYTSGTTGKPKGCLLSNFYFLNVGQRYLDEGGLCAVRPGEERLITPLPFFHMNALAVSTTAMILSGGCLVQLDRFHPRTWWRDGASGADRPLPGRHAGVLLASRKDPAHRVRFGFGANANPKDHAAFEARFGFPLIEAWAMTETGGGAMIAASREPRHVGRGAWVSKEKTGLKIDEERRAARAPGRADPRRGFFSGYLKDDAATEHAWRDGWFHTGDAVRRGPDGALHFVDRLKNIIRRAGENIAALEVEAALAGHPAIAQAAVIAVPDSSATRKSWPAWSCSRSSSPAAIPRSRSRTGASSALPTSRRPGMSLSSIPCPPPRPTRCKRPSSPISPSMRPTPSTCVSERREPRRKPMTA